MVGSLLQPHIFTANLLFLGLIQGLIIAVLAMGIVLIYRSSRVINFAVGEFGVPIAALLLFLVSKAHWGYWPALAFAVATGTAAGAVVELVVIRRLFKAPRVILLEATVGIAQIAQAVALIPVLHDRSGEGQTTFPSPFSGSWEVGSVTVKGSQLMVLIVVPIITIGLW